MNELIATFTRQKTVQELVDLLTEHEVPHAPILGIKDALAQPQAVAREMVVETEHEVLGKIPIVNRPIKFPGDAQPVPEAPPVLGQHTDEILARRARPDGGTDRPVAECESRRLRSGCDGSGDDSIG